MKNIRTGLLMVGACIAIASGQTFAEDVPDEYHINGKVYQDAAKAVAENKDLKNFTCVDMLGFGGKKIRNCVGQGSAKAPSTATAKSDSIREHCERIVGDSYSLLEICIQGEEKAKRNIQSMSVDAQIMAHCEKTVGNGFALMEICLKSEMEAKARLGTSVSEANNPSQPPTSQIAPQREPSRVLVSG